MVGLVDLVGVLLVLGGDLCSDRKNASIFYGEQ